MNQCCVGYTEQDFFHRNGGSPKLAAFRGYTLACSAALSFPCSISSTVSEGAIQFFAFKCCIVLCNLSSSLDHFHRTCPDSFMSVSLFFPMMRTSFPWSPANFIAFPRSAYSWGTERLETASMWPD